MTKKRILLAGLLAVGLLSATVAGAAVLSDRWDHVPAREHGRANPLAGRAEAVPAGAMLYRDHCQQCHKADAQGDGHKKPPLRTDRLRTATDGDIEWFLRQGDLRRGMPSWSGLPEAQRWQIVAYLRSIQ
ncbi:MAG TPA: cytochrome c [Terracidiphilus sp.]|jgi:mono/diheme cytochrome c family protein